MMHSVEELYCIDGRGCYTWDYICAKGIPVVKSLRDRVEGDAYTMSGFGPNTGSRRMYDADGYKIIYLYGEKTWFDTEEERDAYRAQRNVERAESARRNKAKAKVMTYLDTLTTEQIEKIAKLITK